MKITIVMLIITASLAPWTSDEVNAEQSSDEYRENKFRHLCQNGSLCAEYPYFYYNNTYYYNTYTYIPDTGGTSEITLNGHVSQHACIQ